MMFDSLISLLPHQPPMRLVTRCLDVSDSRSVCEVEFGGNPLFEQGSVPSLFAVELIAQCGALILASDAMRTGSSRGGRLVSARKFIFHQAEFHSAQTLTVETALINKPDDDLLLFAGRVSCCDGLLAEGQVAVYRADD